MSFENDLWKEITFFVRAKDEELALFKLDKIGIDRSDLSIRTMPSSGLKNIYLVELVNEDYIKCINCDHVKVSHQTLENNVNDVINQTCYGLHDNQKCNCQKFISVTSS